MAGKAEKSSGGAEKGQNIDQLMQDLDNKIAGLDISPEQMAQLNEEISEAVNEKNDQVNEIVADTKNQASKLSTDVGVSVLGSTVNNKSMSENGSLIVTRENVVTRDISLKDFLQLANV